MVWYGTAKMGWYHSFTGIFVCVCVHVRKRLTGAHTLAAAVADIVVGRDIVVIARSAIGTGNRVEAKASPNANGI
jgi:hypothetical protein